MSSVAIALSLAAALSTVPSPGPTRTTAPVLAQRVGQFRAFLDIAQLTPGQQRQQQLEARLGKVWKRATNRRVNATIQSKVGRSSWQHVLELNRRLDFDAFLWIFGARVALPGDTPKTVSCAHINGTPAGHLTCDATYAATTKPVLQLTTVEFDGEGRPVWLMVHTR